MVITYRALASLLVAIAACTMVRANTIEIPSPLTDRTNVAARVSETYGRLPLSFEANRGQVDPRVDYVARAHGYSVFLRGGETVLTLRAQAHSERGASAKDVVLRMQLHGARPGAQGIGGARSAGTASYFIGSDSSKWHTQIPMYDKVRYAGVYAGIDVVYHADQRRLEYDFEVAPGADPRRIAIAFHGAKRVTLDRDGTLVLDTDAGTLRQPKPVVYQDVGDERQVVAGDYVLRKDGRVGFRVGPYDRSRTLVIDPTVVLYGTYLGGAAPLTGGNETGYSIAVDGNRNAYVAGVTNASDFPSTTPLAPESNKVPPYITGKNTPTGFVAKLDASGRLAYAVYIGGSCTDIVYGIAVNTSGEAHITGATGSGLNPSFNNMPDCSPATTSPATTFYSFPQYPASLNTRYNGQQDAFVAKINATGDALVYSRTLGGSRMDVGRGIAVDRAGNAYVTGDTLAPQSGETGFPTTNGSVNAGSQDMFVTKLDPSGNLLYSVLLGGENEDGGRGIGVDASGNAYIAGYSRSGSVDGLCKPTTPFPTTVGAFQPQLAPAPQFTPPGGGPTQCTPNVGDAVVVKLDSSGNLLYSTYLGGRDSPSTVNDGAFDEAHAIAVDDAGDVYVTGIAGSADFPLRNPIFTTYGGGSAPPGDAFLSKLSLKGQGNGDLLFSTYLNVGTRGEGNAVAVNTNRDVYVAGNGLPQLIDALANGFGGGGFLMKLHAIGATGTSVAYATGLAASNNAFGLAVDQDGNAYVTGETGGSLATTAGTAFPNFQGGVTDAFVLKIGPGTASPAGATTLTVSPASGTYFGSVNLAATLFSSGSPVAGQIVTFSVNGTMVGSTTTDANGVASLLAIPITTVNVGVYTNAIGAMFKSAGGYSDSSGTADLTVTKAPSTTLVTCTSPVTYDGTPQTPCSASATGAGSLAVTAPVSYTSNVNAGPVTASASFTGDQNHMGSSDSQTFTIDKATSITTVTCASSVTYSGAAQTPCTAVVTGAGSLNQSLAPAYSNNTNAGTATASASYSGDANHTSSRDTKAFTIGKAMSTTTVTCPTSVTYTGAAQTPCTAAVTGAGNLNQLLAPSYSNNVNAGTASVTAAYGGDANHVTSNGSGGFGIARAISTIALTCPATVMFTGSALTPCTAIVTGAGGLSAAATLQYANNTAVGTATVTANYLGDVNHNPTTALTQFQIVAPVPQVGQFILGDRAQLNQTVYFWGSQWQRFNPLTGGDAPNAFKGFADTVSTIACGGTWVTRPGNSASAPAILPDYVAMIVATSVQKSGSVITGDVKKIVLVKVDPGYANSPGHVGTGKVVQVLCGN